MKQIVIFYIVSLFGFGNINAQGYKIGAEIISNGGGNISGGVYSNFGVIGETTSNKIFVGGVYEFSIGILYPSNTATRINEDINNLEFNIYPNPTKEYVNVYSKNVEGFEVYFHDILGQLLYTVYINSKTSRIDISRFRPGIYLITLIDSKGNTLFSKKIIVE